MQIYLTHEQRRRIDEVAFNCCIVSSSSQSDKWSLEVRLHASSVVPALNRALVSPRQKPDRPVLGLHELHPWVCGWTTTKRSA